MKTKKQKLEKLNQNQMKKIIGGANGQVIDRDKGKLGSRGKGN